MTVSVFSRRIEAIQRSDQRVEFQMNKLVSVFSRRIEAIQLLHSGSDNTDHGRACFSILSANRGYSTTMAIQDSHCTITVSVFSRRIEAIQQRPHADINHRFPKCFSILSANRGYSTWRRAKRVRRRLRRCGFQYSLGESRLFPR